MTRHHRHHPKTHGPSLLARKGLLAIVKVDKTEIGRHHFVAAESVSGIYEDGGGIVHMTVALDESLSLRRAGGREGVGAGLWKYGAAMSGP